MTMMHTHRTADGQEHQIAGSAYWITSEIQRLDRECEQGQQGQQQSGGGSDRLDGGRLHSL